jgi:hypothetical protein
MRAGLSPFVRWDVGPGSHQLSETRNQETIHLNLKNEILGYARSRGSQKK